MTNKSNYNVGQFGKTIQQTIYNDENEDLDLNSKKNKNKKLGEINMPKTQPSGRKEIIDVDAWINLGGKGFFVKIEGKEYMTSIESVKALLNGEKQGVKLGLLKE